MSRLNTGSKNDYSEFSYFYLNKSFFNSTPNINETLRMKFTYINFKKTQFGDES